MNEVVKFDKLQFEEINSWLESNDNTKFRRDGNIFRSDRVVITVYNTGKILIQGEFSGQWKDKLIQAFSLESNNLRKEEITSSQLVFPRIGTDESGKGDFFGPLVTVAYLVVNDGHFKKLVSLGVKDSKTISDGTISRIAKELRMMGDVSVISISPKKYNELYGKMGNLNSILAWSHARAIENILERHQSALAIVDKFAGEMAISSAMLNKGKNIQLVMRTQAEDDYAVAAASIIARDEFLKGLKIVSMTLGIEVPKGSGQQVLDVSVAIAKKRGLGIFSSISKTHFKTFDQIRDRIT